MVIARRSFDRRSPSGLRPLREPAMTEKSPKGDYPELSAIVIIEGLYNYV